MKTSARNQFKGSVEAVNLGAVNAEVKVDLGSGDHLVAIITNESARNLELAPGKPVVALIKASSVILMTGEGAMTSARNRLCGKVVACTEGAVNGEVIIGLPGGNQLTSIITNESIRKLGLAVGGEVCGLVKASSIILAIEG